MKIYRFKRLWNRFKIIIIIITVSCTVWNWWKIYEADRTHRIKNIWVAERLNQKWMRVRSQPNSILSSIKVPIKNLLWFFLFFLFFFSFYQFPLNELCHTDGIPDGVLDARRMIYCRVSTPKASKIIEQYDAEYLEPWDGMEHDERKKSTKYFGF